jgi:hypothetical protein
MLMLITFVVMIACLCVGIIVHHNAGRLVRTAGDPTETGKYKR